LSRAFYYALELEIHTLHSKTLKGRDLLKDQDMDGRIIKWMLGQSDLRICTGLIWLRIKIVDGLF
jgi:hypothetical protein